MPATDSTDAHASEIERKLHHVMFTDDTGRGVFSCVRAHPAWAEHKPLTEPEEDLRDWGVVYGMAFALMREQEPWEPLEDVAARAVDVAWRMFQAWGSGIEEPTRPGDDGSTREV